MWEELPSPTDTPQAPQFAAPNPPGRAVDSLVIASGGRQTNYAILEDGSVWTWDYAVPPDSMGGEVLAAVVLLPICALASLVIGIIISVIIAVLAWRWGALKTIATIVITILLAFATALGFVAFIL
jgi:hypothetical protein